MSKKEQFQHNLKKAKRQAKADREQNETVNEMYNLFAMFGEVYKNEK